MVAKNEKKVATPLKKKKIKKNKNKKPKHKKPKKAKPKIAKALPEIPAELNEKISKNWGKFNLDEKLMLGIKSKRFESPFPIQSECLIPAIRDYQDIFGASQTGSGKTLAFALPVLQNIITLRNKGRSLEKGGLKSVIFTPTRELALQVSRHIKDICAFSEIKVVTVTGGFFEEKQKRVLSKKPEIVVATPGRFWDLLDNGNEHLNDLTGLRSIVLDEADRLISQGHFREILEILRRINEKIESNSKKPQIFVFSATLDLSRKLEEKYSKENFFKRVINLLPVSKKPFVADLTNEHKTSTDLKETIYKCYKEGKDLFVYYFVDRYKGKTLIFVNSIFSLKRLVSILTELQINVNGLHSKMQQRQRLRNLERFKNSVESCVLVCTDIVSRGLDIPEIENVLHYNIPRDSETYIHRCGRTARATKKGFSVCLVTKEDKTKLEKIETGTNRPNGLPKFSLEQSVLNRLNPAVKTAVELENSFLLPNRKVEKKELESQRAKKTEPEEIKTKKAKRKANNYSDEKTQILNAKRKKEMGFLRKKLGKMIANSEIDGKIDNNNGSKKRGKKFSINVTKMGDLVRKKDGFIELRKKNETKAIDEQK